MKAVVLNKLYDAETGEFGQVACCDMPMPEMVNDDDILIKIAYASICGSDPHALKGFFPNKKLMSIVGHEVSGTVEKLGPKATKKGLKVGDKVTGNFFLPCGTCWFCDNELEQFCKNGEYKNGTMAEYIVWRESQVYKLPDDVDLAQAALVEPFAMATHAVELADMKIGSRVAVSGGGGIGLMLVQLLKLCGASSVTLIEPIESKRRLALETGADFVIDPAKEDVEARASEITGNIGFDAILESSGNGGAAETCLKIARPGANILYMAMYPIGFHLPYDLLKYSFNKELKLQGMYLAQEAFPSAIAMLPRMNLKPLISKIFPLNECVQAYEAAMSGECIKVLFDCEK